MNHLLFKSCERERESLKVALSGGERGLLSEFCAGTFNGCWAWSEALGRTTDYIQVFAYSARYRLCGLER